MNPSARPTQFGRIQAPDEAWLATRAPETILEPELPIIDTHHHLWERSDHRYLLHEFLADVRTGHNLVASVFMECHSMYRASGPVEMRPVGETEFVNGIGAMSDSGSYGPTRVAAAISGLPTSHWVTEWSRCWRPICAPEAGDSAVCGIPPRGIRAR